MGEGGRNLPSPHWNMFDLYLPKLGKDQSDKLRESMFLSFILCDDFYYPAFPAARVTRVFFDREHKITRSVTFHDFFTISSTDGSAQF